MPPVSDPPYITRYLLRDLPEEDQEAFEREYFTSPEAFEELLAVENELIDAYLAGRLPPEQQEGFQRAFLDQPERRERVEFARALKQLAVRASSATPPAALLAGMKDEGTWRRASWWAAAAAVTIVGLGGIWSAARLWSTRNDLEQARHERDQLQQRAAELEGLLGDQRARSARLEGDLASARSQLDAARAAVRAGPAPAAAMVALVLAPGLQRDLGPRSTLEVPPGTRWIQLQLLLKNDAHSAYHVTLETAEGRTVLTRQALHAARGPSGLAVSLRLEADQVPDGHYVVTVSGVSPAGPREPVGDYSFRVLRRNRAGG